MRYFPCILVKHVVFKMSKSFQTLEFDGINIEFPYVPYQCQAEYMAKVIEALKNNKNAVLESPTGLTRIILCIHLGTGKTLCLLCASLGFLRWQRKQQEEFGGERLKIIYSSRTHSQLNQVARELRKTSYVENDEWSLNATTLSSREQTCIHTKVRSASKTNSDFVRQCSYFVKSRQCSAYYQANNANRFVKQSLANTEELVRLGKENGFCPFFASKQFASNADLILAPYNYLFSREAPVSLSGAIVVLDEGHNIEGTCEDLSSFTISAGEVSIVRHLMMVIFKRWQELSNEEEIAMADGTFVSYGSSLRNDESNSTNRKELRASSLLIPHDDSSVTEFLQVFKAIEMLRESLLSLKSSMTVHIPGLHLSENEKGIILSGLELLNFFSKSSIIPSFAPILVLVLNRLSTAIESDIASGGVPLIPEITSDVLNSVDSLTDKICCLFGVDISNIKEFMRQQQAQQLEGLPTGANNQKNIKGRSTASMSMHTEAFTALALHFSENSLASKRKGFDSLENSFEGMDDEDGDVALNCWCFSAAPKLQMLMDQGVKSILITSGTLSPIPAFIKSITFKPTSASNLSLSSSVVTSRIGKKEAEQIIDAGDGTHLSFPVMHSGAHVAKLHQVCASILSCSKLKSDDKNTTRLIGTFERRSSDEYLSSISTAIEEIVSNVGGGCLIVFPSYSVMDNIYKFMEEKGFCSRIRSNKQIFVEPKGTAALVDVLKSYIDASTSGAKNVMGVGGNVRDAESKGLTTGSVLFIVCRGKASEGLDVADHLCRLVFVVSIPLPYALDHKSRIKRLYIQKSEGAGADEEWYKLQASRAVSQAIGRVLRHSKDFGCVVLADARYDEPVWRTKLPSWIPANHLPALPLDSVVDRVKSFFSTLPNDLVEVAQNKLFADGEEAQKEALAQLRESLAAEKLSNQETANKQNALLASGIGRNILGVIRKAEATKSKSLSSQSGLGLFENEDIDQGKKVVEAIRKNSEDTIKKKNELTLRSMMKNDQTQHNGGGLLTKIASLNSSSSSANPAPSSSANRAAASFLLLTGRNAATTASTPHTATKPPANPVTSSNCKLASHPLPSSKSSTRTLPPSLRVSSNARIPSSWITASSSQQLSPPLPASSTPRAVSALAAFRNESSSNNNSSTTSTKAHSNLPPHHHAHDNSNIEFISSRSDPLIARLRSSSSQYSNSSSSNPTTTNSSSSVHACSQNFETPIESQQHVMRASVALKDFLSQESNLDQFNDKDGSLPLTSNMNNNAKEFCDSQKPKIACEICCERFSYGTGEIKRSLICQHEFCSSCWAKCLKVKLECPVCTQRVRTTFLQDC